MADIRTSGMGGTPFGDTTGRPSNPSVGQTYYNGQLGYLEIYTTSGWIPATGANDFSLNLSGTNTAITFNTTYSAGSYSIVSASNDTTLDVYVYAIDGSLAGYTNTKSLTTTQRFNKIVIIGGTNNDVLSFSYKTTYSTSLSVTDINAGPYITSITPSSMPNQNDTITITGGNFATDVAVAFTGTAYSATPAKSIVRSSSTSLIVTRPDNFPVSGSPYTVTVTNPSVANQPTGSSLNISSNSITAGASPSWTTSTSISGIYSISPQNISNSISLVATDADNGSAITYSIISGSLPTGLSLNSSTGIISGSTTSTSSPVTFTARATDSGGNYLDRTFSLTMNPLIGSTSSNPATTAHQIYTQFNGATDGLYWIKPDNYATARQLYCYFRDNTGWIVIGRTGSSNTTYTSAPGFYNDGNIPNSSTNGSISLFDWSNTYVGNSTLFRWFDPAVNAYVEWNVLNLTSIKASPDTFSATNDSIQMRYTRESGNGSANTYLWKWARGVTNQNAGNVPNFATTDGSSPFNSYGNNIWYNHAADANKRGWPLANGANGEAAYGLAGLQRYSDITGDGRTNQYAATGILTLINPR